jgi:hypothetical protein
MRIRQLSDTLRQSFARWSSVTPVEPKDFPTPASDKNIRRSAAAAEAQQRYGEMIALLGGGVEMEKRQTLTWSPTPSTTH